MKKTVNQPQSRLAWLLISLLGLISLTTFAIGVASNAQWIQQFDQSLTALLREPITSAKSSFFIPITEMGSTKTLALLTIFFCLFIIWHKKNWGASFWLALNVGVGAGLVNVTLKHVFLRQRPTISHLVQQGGYSFPSGHSTGSLIFYSSVAFILISYVSSKLAKFLIGTLALFMIISIGVSRIYVGVHFPSDVAGGFSLGITWMGLVIAYYPSICDWFSQQLTYLDKE